MLNREIEDKLANIIVERIEKINTTILNKMGETIKQMSTLSATQAHQLGQMLKYGASYNEIARELAKISGKNVQDIYKIFSEVAKHNKQFAKQFYAYRKIDFIPYANDIALQNQVKSIATLTANTYLNITNTKGIGFLFEDINGNIIFKNIQESYYEVIDRSVMAVTQGKNTFQEEMRRTMQIMGNNGLVLYSNGRTRRLDSAIRMNMLDGIRQLTNENNKRFAEEYGANMVEISHHQNSAPDHIYTVDGKQFARINVIIEQINNGTEKEIKLEDIKDNKVKVKGKLYDDYDTVNNSLTRKVSTLNCRHYELPGILGISKPQYTEEQLEEDKKKNEEGFELDGKHYTLYEGEQLQRRLELEARKNKDVQILARSSGDKELAQESEKKIREIVYKYNELCQISGLKPKKDRMAVSGYRRIKVA